MRIQFWYDLASSYSYLTAMRIEAAARAAGVDVVWRPFLLGPIFKRQGWSTSPFNIYPAKGAYMRRDIARIAAARGLPFVMPEPFPAHSLLAARLAHSGEQAGWTAPFSRAVFEAGFARGENISEEATLRPILAALGLDPEQAFARAGSTEIKESLRRRTAEAMEAGIFGAPTVLAHDGELFWGDDRLEQAQAWARRLDG